MEIGWKMVKEMKMRRKTSCPSIIKKRGENPLRG